MPDSLREQLALLPDRLAHHLTISLLALALAAAISLPLAVLVLRVKPLRWFALTAAGAAQTIPSLALLALVVAVSGAFGFWPALVALTIYAILPILRNAVTGLAGVDAAYTEAARGSGMTSAQSLFRVELPLAAPVIIAGLRTATVWTVGIATLTTPVGYESLGNFIFSGLQTNNTTAILVGALAAAALAVVLDSLIGAAQWASERRSRAGLFAALAATAAVVALGLLSPHLFTSTGPQRATAATAARQTALNRPIRVGGKPFTEQYILADLIAQKLRAAGFEVEKAESLGSTLGFDALKRSQIDVFVDYTGTIWSAYMRRDATAPAWQTLNAADGWMADQFGIRDLGRLGFENAYALAMRRDRAAKLGIKTIDDLAKHAGELTIGSDYEFFSRPDWFKLRDAYGLKFAAQRTFDPSFLFKAAAGGEVDVITAYSTDGRISANDLIVLDDPRNGFPPYDAVLLLSPEVADVPGVVDALQPMVGSISDDRMRAANQAVDVDGKSPATVGETLSSDIEKSDPK